MKTRIIAAGILLPLLLVIVLVLPTIYTAILFGIMAAIGAYELLWGTGLVKHPRLTVYTAVMSFLTAICSHYGLPYPFVLIGILVFVAVLYGEMLASKGQLAYEKLLVCLAGGVLIPFMLCALVRLHSGENGRFLILIPFVLAFLSDTGAYFVGCKFGKHKLAPEFASPITKGVNIVILCCKKVLGLAQDVFKRKFTADTFKYKSVKTRADFTL